MRRSNTLINRKYKSFCWTHETRVQWSLASARNCLNDGHIQRRHADKSRTGASSATATSRLIRYSRRPLRRKDHLRRSCMTRWPCSASTKRYAVASRWWCGKWKWPSDQRQPLCCEDPLWWSAHEAKQLQRKTIDERPEILPSRYCNPLLSQLWYIIRFKRMVTLNFCIKCITWHRHDNESH